MKNLISSFFKDYFCSNLCSSAEEVFFVGMSGTAIYEFYRQYNLYRKTKIELPETNFLNKIYHFIVTSFLSIGFIIIGGFVTLYYFTSITLGFTNPTEIKPFEVFYIGFSINYILSKFLDKNFEPHNKENKINDKLEEINKLNGDLKD